MNSMERFDETSLPSKEQFLTSCMISMYQSNSMNMPKMCSTMKDYHNHYLITDILLLADVFESFRKMSLETYDLDLIHYYSLPSLS